MARDPLPGDQSAQPLTLFSSQEYVSYEGWNAPMPPPALLRQYDEVVPGLAARIVGMTEKSITGHIDRDNRLADAEIEISKTGQSMAFVLTLIALVASIVLFAKGNTVAAAS